MTAGFSSLTHHTLYTDPRFFSGFPAVVRTEDRLLLCFRRGRDPRYWLKTPQAPAAWTSHLDSRSHLALLPLDAHTLAPLDDARVVPPDPEAADQDSSLLVLPDGQILLGGFAWYPFPSAAMPLFVPGLASMEDSHSRARAHITTYLLWGASLRWGNGEASSFGEPRYLPAIEGAVGRDPWASQRPVFRGGLRGAMVASDDDIFVPAYGDFGGVSAAHLFVVSAAQQTMQYRACMLYDDEEKVHMHEPALCMTPSGRLIVYARTGGLGDRIATAYSDDRGHSWSPYRIHETQGHPVHPLWLPDGRLLLTYGYRHPPYGVRARIVEDPLAFDEAEEIILRDDGQSTDLGYPWAATLPDGDVLVTYYWEQPDGTRQIEATRCRF